MANHQEVGQGIEWPEYILGRVDKVPEIQPSDVSNNARMIKKQAPTILLIGRGSRPNRQCRTLQLGLSKESEKGV